MKKTLVFVFCFLLTQSVFALTLTPPRIELTLSRGESASSELVVINEELPNNTPDKTYYISVEKLNNKKSGISFTSGDYSNLVKVPEKITIRNGATIKIPFLVTLPDDAIQTYNFTIFLSTYKPEDEGEVVGAKVGFFLLIHVPNGYTESAVVTQPVKVNLVKKAPAITLVSTSTKEQPVSGSVRSFRDKFMNWIISFKNIWVNN